MEEKYGWRDLDPMLKPRSIAIVGASSKNFGIGNQALRSLTESGYAGDLHVVSTSSSSIEGIATVPAVGALPHGLDTAFIAVPARGVLAVLQDLEAVGCASAIVTSAKFTPAEESAIKEFVAGTKMTVHGPNNMGIINYTDRVPLWAEYDGINADGDGDIAFVGQSGAACIFVAVATGRGSFSKIISSGSQWQLTAADYIDWLVKDDSTKVIGLNIESITDVDRFIEAVRRARDAGKPIIVLKAGRSLAGAAATQAHTGALVAANDYYQALFEHLDIPTVRDYDEFAGALIAHRQVLKGMRKPSSEQHVAALTMSGGQSAIIADIGSDFGIQMAPLTAATRAKLMELLPGTPGDTPVDFGGSQLAEPDVGAVAAALMADETVGSLFFALDAPLELSNADLEIELHPVQIANSVFEDSTKPLVIGTSSGASIHSAFRKELRNEIDIIRGFQPTVVGLDSLRWNQRPVESRAAIRQRWGRVPEQLVSAWRETLGRYSGVLPRQVVADLFRDYGIPLISSEVVDSMEEVQDAASRVGFPVTVKVVSQDVPHRSDVGGVEVSIADPEALRAAMERMSSALVENVPGARIEGFEIQETVQDATEVLVGSVSAPGFGSLLVVGTGGTLVELHRDRASRIAPTDHVTAREQLLGTRVARVLDGYRNLVPRTSVEPLVDLQVALSALAFDMEGVITEIDLNPVLVRHGNGHPYIVDALVVVKEVAK